MAPDNEDENPESENELDLDEADPDVDEPKKYAVLLHNDDYTTMEFVIEVLERYFHKTKEQAFEIMLRVHKNGHGVAGLYSRDIAETKAHQVTELARSKGYPLLCTVERST